MARRLARVDAPVAGLVEQVLLAPGAGVEPRRRARRAFARHRPGQGEEAVAAERVDGHRAGRRGPRARAAWKARARSRAATRNARSAARRSSEAGANGPQPNRSHVAGSWRSRVERLAARVDERAGAGGRQQLVDGRHPAHDRGRERRVGQPHALAARGSRPSAGMLPAFGVAARTTLASAPSPGPGHGRVLGRLGAAVAQVVARHEAAHAVAHEVEARARGRPPPARGPRGAGRGPARSPRGRGASRRCRRRSAGPGPPPGS